MNWNKFLTYGDSPQNAFETLCNQLFERYLKNSFPNELVKFRVINGSGGDGGIEAYGQLRSNDLIAIQSKWFRDVLKEPQFSQIRKSITTAKTLRPHIREYIICIPHDVSSIKFGRGKKGGSKKPITNFEEKAIETFTKEMNGSFSDLKITWWFEKDIELELMKTENEGIHKFWFDQEVISLNYLKKQFDLQRQGWLYERYIPELNGQGIISRNYQEICFLREYRSEQQALVSKVLSEIRICILYINQFVSVNQTVQNLNFQLQDVRVSLQSFVAELENMERALISGNDYYEPIKIPEIDVWDLKIKLEKLKPSNMQKNILPKLIRALENTHQKALSDLLSDMGDSFKQHTRLILGEPGTGKTQGLANCVEKHLIGNLPAIIIQAKGSKCGNWTQLLSNSLELSNWKKEEILSALEALAIRSDLGKAKLLNAGSELDASESKVLICIDGLDENIQNQDEWYNRLRQCEQLITAYPRLRFLFSARRYFFDNSKVPNSPYHDDVFLPREGDVRILHIAPKYFSQEHYNITVSSYSIIRGIDSLLALRLFCERYRNQILTETSKVVTATRDLLNGKIDGLNVEFISTLASKKGATRRPILDALDGIAKYFYDHTDVEHEKLVKLILIEAAYLSTDEVDHLVDFLTNNAILIRTEKQRNIRGLKRTQFYYNITYQSLIEHIISEKVLEDIKSGALHKIPEILHKGMIRTFDFENYDVLDFYQSGGSNKKIIQNIVNNLFLETGKLIGIDNFLTDGFDEVEVKQLQYNALSVAPASIGQKYKARIDHLFKTDFTERSYILQYLIEPASHIAGAFFGAEYFHELLMAQETTFARDKILSGLDSYEIHRLKETEKERYRNGAIEIFFSEDMALEGGYLSHDYLHNERPLIYAWGLSTLNQILRSRLRTALAGWAIKNPLEFTSLLNKVFKCEDPQIQEDLGSIMLGVASKLKNKHDVKMLALWSIENVFSSLDVYCNIIVRQGFRAIVERAFQIGVISITEVKKSRPKKVKDFTLLPLYGDLSVTHHQGIYPIVGDLAWYVIDDSYRNFLEYPSEHDDPNCKEAKALIKKYALKYDKEIYPSNWGMAAGIAYIRSLGLTRSGGNSYTEARQGSKSSVYTFEEKYTWLAVHYIQGYLADYIPIENGNGHREFIKDYTELTDIPNPAESIIFDPDKILEKKKPSAQWIIPETLSKEFENIASNDILVNKELSEWIDEEPNLNFAVWLNFDSKDFQIEGKEKWTAIYNDTSLHDSQEIGYSFIDIKAYLITKSDLTVLKRILRANPDALYFIKHTDGLQSVPRTSTYCNPTDLLWMTWIEEDGVYQEFQDRNDNRERKFFFGVTQVIQNINGEENYLMLPSKKIREMIGCYELDGEDLKDLNGNIKAFRHHMQKGFHTDNQEMVLVERNTLNQVLQQNEYELIWLVNHFKKKNPLNEKLDRDFHVQKTRKYLLWTERGKMKQLKFWDERSSNVRD